MGNLKKKKSLMRKNLTLLLKKSKGTCTQTSQQKYADCLSVKYVNVYAEFLVSRLIAKIIYDF